MAVQAGHLVSGKQTTDEPNTWCTVFCSSAWTYSAPKSHLVNAIVGIELTVCLYMYGFALNLGI